ncbi:MAG TPA: hypothetical protein VFA05_05205 [Gaiellaceae bacterium]|nr:hypothetical protein [Gaiellaceae bacterium]
MCLVFVLAPLVLAAAACGSGGGDPVASAAAATAHRNTEHVEFRGTTVQNGATLVVDGSGDFQTSPQRGTVLFSFRSPQSAGSLHEVLDGWTVYMTSDLFRGRLPAGKAWVSVDLQKAGRAAGIDFSSFSAATPAQSLTQLRSTGKVTRIGTEKIGGVSTTHYRATIDPNKTAAGRRFEQRTRAAYAPIDVWVGGGLVRRLRIGYSAAKLGTTQMTMDFSKFGEPVSITVPPKSVTYDATKAAAAALGSGATP